MNLPDSDGGDASGGKDLEDISSSVRGTLLQLRHAVRQLDKEVTDLGNLKRMTLDAKPTVAERRETVFRQLDDIAEDGNFPTVHVDNHLLQVLQLDFDTEDEAVIQGKECASPSERESGININEYHEGPNVPNEAVEEAHKTFVKLAPLWKGDCVIVILYSFKSSGHFSGRRAGEYSRILYKLNQCMTKYYQDNKETVLQDPKVNSACIVRISLQNSPQKYHRARVESVTGDAIRVFLVDVGYRTAVTRESVLVITDEFVKLQETAVEGKMAAVIPKGGSKFPNIVLDKIKSKVISKEVILRVSKEMRTNSVMEVLLIEVDQGIENCINSWLVLEGDAYFTEESQIASNESTQNISCKNSTRKPVSTKSSSTYSCQVIKIISPARIYLRKLSDLHDADMLAQQMKAHYTSTVEFKKEVFKSGTLAAVLSSGSWERARIIKVTGKKVLVFLLDKAEELKTQVDELKPLPVSFSTKNYTEECYLSGIVPNTKSGSWSKGSISSLKSVIEEGRMIVDVENDGKSGTGSQPVKLYVDIINGPANRRIDLAQRLVSLGSATNIVKKRRLATQVPVYPSIEREFKVPSLVELEDVEELFVWPTQSFPESSIFDAEATYVDWDGVIYLMTRVNRTNLKMINGAIEEQYLDSSPDPEDLFWRVGEAAIVRWSQDHHWYRGAVLRVLPNHCEVRLVDYGTETFVPFTSMRKRLVAEEIPIQSIPFMLANIVPIGGQWTEEQLTEFHELVVDKVLTITNFEDSQSSDHLIGRAKIGDNDVSEVLLSKGICSEKGASVDP